MFISGLKLKNDVQNHVLFNIVYSVSGACYSTSINYVPDVDSFKVQVTINNFDEEV